MSFIGRILLGIAVLTAFDFAGMWRIPQPYHFLTGVLLLTPVMFALRNPPHDQ